MGHTNHYLAIEGEAKDWEEAIRLCGQAIADAGYADETFMNACIEREKNIQQDFQVKSLLRFHIVK